MIEFHHNPTPSSAKVALFLENAGLEHRVVPVETRRGEHHRPEFMAINPVGARALAASASRRASQKPCA